MDPLNEIVTKVVVHDMFEHGKRDNPHYSFEMAKHAVGDDGIGFLHARIAERIKEGHDADALQLELERNYLHPARLMLGIEKPS